MEVKKLIIVLAVLILVIIGLSAYVGVLREEVNHQREVIQLKENELKARWINQEGLENEIRELEIIIWNRDEYIRQLEEGKE